jgi:hypothetical protein
MSERDPLSMSTDNTPEGEMYSDTIEAGPISNVAIGDTVVDSTGKELGTVKFVKMGDPNAVTDEGQEDDSPGFLGLGGDDYDMGNLPGSSISTCHGRTTALPPPARLPASKTTRSTSRFRRPI